jgi:hypothetical protein
VSKCLALRRGNSVDPRIGIVKRAKDESAKFRRLTLLLPPRDQPSRARREGTTLRRAELNDAVVAYIRFFKTDARPAAAHNPPQVNLPAAFCMQRVTFDEGLGQ